MQSLPHAALYLTGQNVANSTSTPSLEQPFTRCSILLVATGYFSARRVGMLSRRHLRRKRKSNGAWPPARSSNFVVRSTSLLQRPALEPRRREVPGDAVHCLTFMGIQLLGLRVTQPCVLSLAQIAHLREPQISRRHNSSRLETVGITR